MPRHQEVPRVDLTAPDAPAALSAALRSWGFVRLAGHGVRRDTIDEAFDRARAFFALPVAAKDRYRDGRGGQRGWSPFLAERAKDRPEPDLKEYWHTGRPAPADPALRGAIPENLDPDGHVPGFSAATQALFSALEQTAGRVLEALAVSLALPPDAFASLAVGGNHVLRALHYPPVDPALAAAGSIRAAAHEDVNLCTLLVDATAPGLQLRARDGRWIPVEGAADEIVADTGDMLQHLTNGVVPSITHRVVNDDGAGGAGARLSMPFFVHPRPDAVLRVFDRFRGPGFPPAGADVTAQAFLEARMREQGLLG